VVNSGRGRVAVAALLLAAPSAGCFNYIPLGDVAPRPGAEVIARLSVPLDVPLQDLTVHGVRMTTGRVVFIDRDSLVIAAERFASETGTDYPGLGTTMTLLRSHIAGVEQRRVSKGRTALLLGASAAALGAIIASVRQLVGSESSGPPGPPQQP